MFSKLTALTATLALALVSAAPALAQAPAASAEDGTVNVTFQLDFEGEVPGWQNFGIDHSLGGEAPIDMMLCTTDAEAGGPDSPLCKTGQTYTGSMEVPVGEPVSFDFVRHDTRTQPEHFQSETRAFDEDATVTATYSFPSGPVEPESPQSEAPKSDTPQNENSPGEDPQNEAPKNETPGAETPSEEPVPESAPEHQYAASEDAADTGSGTAPAGEPEAGPAADAPDTGEASGDDGPALLPETSGAPVILVAGLLLLAGGVGVLAYRRAF
jgi:hypothetical protein